MTGDDIPAARRRIRLSQIVAVLWLVFSLLSPYLSGQTAVLSADESRTGTLTNLHSDKRVVQNGRWVLVREFTVDFAVRDSVTYCGELTTTDATEAHDLLDSGGQVVSVVEKGRDLYVTLKSGRRIRAHRLNPDKCPVGHS